MRAPALITALAVGISAMAQSAYSLDSCRQLALKSNKQLMMSRERINKANFQKQEAFAAYLPR